MDNAYLMQQRRRRLARSQMDSFLGAQGPEEHDRDHPQWVLYDRLARRPYVYRKMDWQEVTQELRVLLQPYQAGPPGDQALG